MTGHLERRLVDLDEEIDGLREEIMVDACRSEVSDMWWCHEMSEMTELVSWRAAIAEEITR